GLKCRVPVSEFVEEGYKAHVLTVPAGDNVARILPALTISEGEIVEAITRLDRAAAGLAPVSAEG
ncbi:MAG: acetylornithine transaminase, partial [Pseudomonadota bacterium]